MREIHHDQPLQDEQRLNAVVDSIREDAARRKLKLEIGDGTAEMGASANVRPIFEGVPN
jgi:hypothetical protein